jgi:predicted protein tyrosine phosphatase
MERRLPSLLVLGYSEAGMLLRAPGAADVGAIISIHGSREPLLIAQSTARRLILEFDDVEGFDSMDPMAVARWGLRRREAGEVGLRLTPPTADHAKAVLEFARSVAGLEAMLLCQCQGGISRGPAAALLCLATWTEPGREEYCVERLLAIRPSAVPHRDIVRFGDALLHRDGRLLAALDRVRPY